jgi:hypothetical protein
MTWETEEVVNSCEKGWIGDVDQPRRDRDIGVFVGIFVAGL